MATTTKVDSKASANLNEGDSPSTESSLQTPANEIDPMKLRSFLERTHQFTSSFLRDPHGADEVTSRIMLDFARGKVPLTALEPGNEALICAIARRRCLNFLRDEIRRLDGIEFVGFRDGPPDFTAVQPLKGMIRQESMELLPERAAKALSMRLEGTPVEDIAGLLGVSKRTVQRELRSAGKLLGLRPSSSDAE